LKLIGTKEICDILGIEDQRTLATMARTISGFPVRKLGGRWKADPVELENWFHNWQEEKPAPEPAKVTSIAPRRRNAQTHIPVFDVRIPS